MYSAFEDSATGVAVIFLFIIIILGGTIFFVAPIVGIVSANQLIEFGAEVPFSVQENITYGLCGTVISFFLGGGWLIGAVCEITVRPPRFRDSSNWNDPVWKKWHIALILGILIWLAQTAGAVYLAEIAFQNWDTNPVLAGKIFITLHSVGMGLFVLGGLGRLTFDY